MQEKHLFEYARIYVMPRVERGEYMNVGVIVYSRSLRFLGMKYIIDGERLKALDPSIDLDRIDRSLRSFSLIAEGHQGGGPIARLDAASRFRWITATKSTVIQVSKVHPGFCSDAGQALEKLFEELVL